MKLSHAPAVIGIALAVFLASAVGSGVVWGQQSQSQQGVSYSQVAPVLQKYCMTCHTGAKPARGLRLDTYENLMQGGNKGKVVTPGEPRKSSLFLRITGDEKPRMPRNGPPWVSQQETATVEEWIARGARP
ncbi:MAG: c-type cytochrome domain-containing protein [Syntrophobacteraceae bacterium]